jgi:hypothetical protein
MAEKTASVKKLSDKNTKQEMLDAYQSLARQLEEKRAAELNPEKRLQEKESQQAVQVAQALPPEGIDREIGSLKSEIGKVLADVTEKMAQEAARFRSLQKAVETKSSELNELYGIEKSAVALAALIEAQSQKKLVFEEEMAREKEELTHEIETTREEWDKERKAHEAEIRERDAAEKKARDREKEAFDYAFKREQQAVKDKLTDEKLTLEKEISRRKEEADKQFAEREKALLDREKELAELRSRAAAFPKELEITVDKAVKEATERIKFEAKSREDLLRKEFEGERNVLNTRIQALELSCKDLQARNEKLSQQIDAAYRKVQEIAEKSIDGASQSKSYSELQKLFTEQTRKTTAEKA